MSIVKFQLLLLTCILTPTFIYGLTSAPPMAKQNCADRCGNITIPFPFGTREGCFYNSSFLVNCTYTPGAEPQLFWGDTNIEIKNISLDQGQLRVMQYIAKSCYRKSDGSQTGNNTYFILYNDMFKVSNTANKFTIIGCDSYGYISGRLWSNKSYSTGCIATCTKMNDLEDKSCMGLGCCQTSEIPRDIQLLNLTVSSFDGHANVAGFNNCTFGFLAEAGAFTFYRDNLTSLMNVEKLPSVVDWVIGKERCEIAQNSTSYACISPDSECLPIKDDGYRCRCTTGYEGNPYLSDGRGCQDIDECSSARAPNCRHECRNSPPGTFTCVCPKSYIIDGDDNQGCRCPRGYSDGNLSDRKLRDGGCIRVEMPIYKPVAGAALGIIIVLLFSCLVHLVLKKRRSNKMKHMYFLQNGGMSLNEKLTARDQSISTSMEREMSSRNDTGKIFSSTELERATNNFHSSMIVGQGGFGTVYKGLLDDNRIVAIKNWIRD